MSKPRSRSRSSTNGTAFRFRRVGVPLSRFNDAFHFFMRVNWWVLLSITFGAYCVANLIFALLYLLDPGGIDGMGPNLFEALWFSVQTMATIGYGGMTPTSFYANAVVFVESFVGIAGVAIGTGVLFARMSRPTAKVAFSETLVVHRRDGVPTLMLRMANERTNQIVEARMTLSVLIDEVTAEGDRMRRLRTLELERSTSPLFTLSWSAFHAIDEESPLYALDGGPLDPAVRAYIVTFAGLDDTYSQTVHARATYLPSQVRLGARFVDMISDLDDGRLQIDHALLSEVEACSRAEAEGLRGSGPPWIDMVETPSEEEEAEIRAEVAVETDEAASAAEDDDDDDHDTAEAGK